MSEQLTPKSAELIDPEPAKLEQAAPRPEVSPPEQLARQGQQDLGEKLLDIAEQGATVVDNYTPVGGEFKMTPMKEQLVTNHEQEAAVKRAEQLSHEVFQEVDIKAAMNAVHQFGEKLDSKKLLEIRNEMRENYQLGAIKMGRYLTEILELDESPDVIYRYDMNYNTLGKCKRREGGDLIQINADRSNPYNIHRQMETIAHEYWHSYQYMMSNTAEGTVQYSRSELYDYNFRNYINAEDDIEAYRKQLVEVEARLFGIEVAGRLKQFEPDPAELKKQVFTEVDQEAIKRTVAEHLQNFDVKELLETTGMSSLKELKQANFAEVAPLITDFLCDMLPMSDLYDLYIGDLSEKKLSSRFNVHDCRIELDEGEVEKRDFDANLKYLAWVVYRCYQNDLVENGERYEERGQLYAYNLEHFVKYSEDDPQKIHQQLVVAESDAFSESFLKAFNLAERKEPYQLLGKKIKKMLGLSGGKHLKE